MGLVQEMPMTGRFARYRETPMKEKPSAEPESVDENRRDFLRNSVYAAYATPLITMLLVDAKSAAASQGCPDVIREKCESGELHGPPCQNC